MTLKTELLEVTDQQDADVFVTFIQRFQSRAQVSDLEEAVGSLSRSELSDVWERVHNICTSVLLGLEEDADIDNNEPNTKQMEDVLQGIVTLTQASMASEAPSLPDTLFDTTVIMHGVLVSLPESADKLKNAMCRVFENWWVRDLEGKDELGTNTLTYLLERTLQTKSALADVKRVWGMREALKLFDINSPTCEHVRRLLLHCFIHVSYLKAEEGRRFLSYLFSLGPETIELFHKTIKNQLPAAPQTLLESYGEVYFQAWRVASGESLQKLEVGCIQDLMHHAVHASRQSSRSLAQVLRKVLRYFHKQKKQRGVDEMLLRLYEPILWRSLKVANGAVRANAASLLVDTFPLQNPESNVEEADGILQKQFDLLQDLLLDPCVEVRVVSIQGVCRIISVYWEVIPQEVIKSLITTLYQDLIYDVSSAEVRVAVIKGQLDLLDNHLCHPLLESLLPTLRDFIHDVSEKVRLSMLELLTRVKSVRGIRFWSIVPMEHLLTRLELDTAPVARRIMKLVFNSFVPADKGSDVQISRCVALLRSNPGAARRFFQFVHKHMNIQESVKYIVLLCRCVLSCVRAEQKKTATEAASNNGSQAEGEDSDGAADDEKENEGQLSVKDVPLMVGLLEAMAILWQSISPSLDKPENAELKAGLRRKFAIAMPEFLNTFQTPAAYSALVLLSGFMPPQLVPHLSRSCLSRLKDMTDENDTKEYSILLEAMCNWGKMADIIELLSDWLEDGLKIPESEQSSTVKVKKTKKKTVAFTDPRVPQPAMAVRYLSCLLSHPVCQDLLLTNCRSKLTELSSLLKSVTKCLEKRFVSVEALGPRTSDRFLTQAFIMYQKLEILLFQPERNENTAVMAMEQLYAWADVELLSALRQKSDEEESTQCESSRKRKIDSQTEALVNLALELVKSLLVTGNNMLLVGIGDQEFASQLTDFVSLCLRTDRNAELLPLAAEALFQLAEHWRVCENETDDGVGSHSSLIPSLFSQFLQSLAASINKENSPRPTLDTERAHTLLGSMKGTLTEMLQAVYRCQHLDNRVVSEVMASVMSAVVSDLTFHSKVGTLDHEELCQTLAELPPMSAFLLTTISKKNYMATSFLSEFEQCIQSGSLSGLHSLNGAVYLMANLFHCKPSMSGGKDCLTSMQSLVDRVRAEMTDLGEDSPDRLVLDGLTSSLRRTQDQLMSV